LSQSQFPPSIHPYIPHSLQAPGAPRYYFAICDYNPGDSDDNGISLTDGQEVEVIGINQFGWWWVRATSASSGETEEGWVPASYLKVFSKRDQVI
jgi:hypothetical protein